MKKIVLVLFLLFTFNSVFSADFIGELKISIARAQKGSTVEYVLYLPNGNKEVFTGADFIKGKIIERDGVPLYFELFNQFGAYKRHIMISLQNALYYELEIEKTEGIWNYSFHFHY